MNRRINNGLFSITCLFLKLTHCLSSTAREIWYSPDSSAYSVVAGPLRLACCEELINSVILITGGSNKMLSEYIKDTKVEKMAYIQTIRIEFSAVYLRIYTVRETKMISYCESYNNFNH